MHKQNKKTKRSYRCWWKKTCNLWERSTAGEEMFSLLNTCKLPSMTKINLYVLIKKLERYQSVFSTL